MIFNKVFSTRTRILATVFAVYVGVVLVLVGSGALFLGLAARAVQQKDIPSTVAYLGKAGSLWWWIDHATVGCIPQRELISAAVGVVDHIPAAIQTLTTATATSELSAHQLIPLLVALEKLHLELEAYPEYRSQLQSRFPAWETLKHSTPVVRSFLETTTVGQHTWMIVFQNSDELRGMGGFMGSYALLNWTDGVLSDIAVEDIYDLSGQIPDGIPAPPGVSEYLSGGYGLKLPDANWEPDPQLSAATIGTFFGKAGKTPPEVTVFVTTTAVKELLATTGPIPLSDGTPLTSDTLTQILSSHHQDYFPGSTKKKQLMSEAVTQLRIAAAELSVAAWTRLVDVFSQQIAARNIAVVARSHTLTQELEAAQLTRLLRVPSESRPLWLIESNVGINKANAHVTRTWELALDTQRSELTITFTNSATPPDPSQFSAYHVGAKHLGYNTYLRLWVEESAELAQLQVNGAAVAPVIRTLQLANGQKIKEIGFLVSTPEKSSSTITLSLTHTPGLSRVSLLKQAGLAPVPITIAPHSTFPQKVLLTTDRVIEF